MENKSKYLNHIFIPLAIIAAIILVGSIGYHLIEGYSFSDAFYMTIITISTVGFQEVHPLSSAGKWFTSFLIIVSFGTFAYAITLITSAIASGEIREFLAYRKLNMQLKELNNHVIICGHGRNGKQAALLLQNHNQPFVVIEKSQDKNPLEVANSYPVIEGDSTHDENLILAGIEKASALITTLPEDTDNLFIVLTARTLNPKLIIISRASMESSGNKLKKAGANHVIMPDLVGGAHMASMMLKPDVMQFLDKLTGIDVDQNIEEIPYQKFPSEWKNKSLDEINLRMNTGVLVVGVKIPGGEFLVNPPSDFKPETGCKLFVIGNKEQIRKLRSILT